MMANEMPPAVQRRRRASPTEPELLKAPATAAGWKPRCSAPEPARNQSGGGAAQARAR